MKSYQGTYFLMVKAYTDRPRLIPTIPRYLGDLPPKGTKTDFAPRFQQLVIFRGDLVDMAALYRALVAPKEM